MKKTLSIDLSSDRLIGVAATLVEEHNYIGALKMLNKNAELNCNDEDAFMLYAEIFDDIGLYEKCINNWFKYIDCTVSEELTDAYEGLALAYLNIGNDSNSAYYYDKLLDNSDAIDPEMRLDIMDTFLSRDENPLKVVYPPALADYSEEITRAIGFMKKGDYEQAIKVFETVSEESEFYFTARNYIAMCNVICDRNEQAEAECLAVLEKQPQNVQALTTLAAVRTEQKRVEESRELACRLLEIKSDSVEEIYKIATVCCENKLHEEAYGLFCKLEGDLGYDNTVLYFKAVSAFNCGKYKESFDAFDKILTIYPHAVTARYYYNKAREMVDSGKIEELSYFYRMPQEERESTLKILAAFSALSAKQARKFQAMVDITDCILWCFDECMGPDGEELQTLGAICAVKAGLDGLVSDILLNAFLPDTLKVRVLSAIGERNEYNSFGVVICHVYDVIGFRALELGKAKRKYFISAYSKLASHFAIFNRDAGEKFALTAEKLYNELQVAGKLDLASDFDALTAAIYFRSGVKKPDLSREKLSEFFGADDNKISELLGE